MEPTNLPNPPASAHSLFQLELLSLGFHLSEEARESQTEDTGQALNMIRALTQVHH